MNWERSRVRVPSSKTEHHDGGESRIIPLFPELRPYLLEVFEQAEPGTQRVITRYRGGNANLRTQLQRIIRRADLEPWPKLFQNLRSTRETELAEEYPMHVVCKWIGNSQPVAAQHYLQLTDEHFERALRGNHGAGESEAAQNAAQNLHEMTRNTPKQRPAAGDEPESNSSKNDNLQLASAYCGSGKMPGTGVEPAREVNPTAPSTRRVCQFRHPGDAGHIIKNRRRPSNCAHCPTLPRDSQRGTIPRFYSAATGPRRDQSGSP